MVILQISIENCFTIFFTTFISKLLKRFYQCIKKVNYGKKKSFSLGLLQERIEQTGTKSRIFQRINIHSEN